MVYCEACDKSFRDERELYLHTLEHEVCGREGCIYSAHPKLVAKHVKMQHETGLYSRIGKLSTEEDISRWLEERKRRYPTRKVVEEKKALQEEKIKRGERIKEDDSKFNKSFIKKRERQKGKSLKKMVSRKNSSRKKKEWGVSLTVEEVLNEEKKWKGSVPPFGGIRNEDNVQNDSQVIKSEEDKNRSADNITDEEWEATTELKEPQLVSNSLGLLATCYDSASSDEAPEEVKTIRGKEQLIPEESLQPEKRPRGRSKRNRKDEGNKEITIKSSVQPKRKRELTLLEKLLSREIRHERNVILQCIRYAVNNNFFA